MCRSKNVKKFTKAIKDKLLGVDVIVNKDQTILEGLKKESLWSRPWGHRRMEAK